MRSRNRPSGRSSRRLVIERHLAGLPPPPRRGSPTRSQAKGAERYAAAAWRQALAQMGPWFTACGHYLASRSDLLPTELRRELVVPATPVASSAQAGMEPQLEQELGQAPEWLARPSEQSWQTGLLFHTCRTRLPNGESVTAKLVRSELGPNPAEDLNLLPLLAPRLALWAGDGEDAQRFEDVLESARRTFESEVDLAWEAEALITLSSTSPGLHIPRVYRQWSTPRLLVLEAIDAQRLVELPAGPARDELAFRLCLVWLQSVLMDACFPRLPTPDNVGVTAEERIAFRDTGFVRPRPSWQDLAWQYLEASAAHDPDQTGTALAAMASIAGDEEALSYRLRQLQPLRDTSGPLRRDELGEHLQMHWRLATELGFRLQPALIELYRGLGALQDVLRRLAPAHDVLLAAFEQLRLDAELARWRERLAPERLSQDLEVCTSALRQLPQRLDRALVAATSGQLMASAASESAVEGPRKRPPRLGVALLSVCFTVTLLLEQLAALPLLEKLAAVVLILVVALLLEKLIED